VPRAASICSSRSAIRDLAGLVEDALGEVVPQAVFDLDARVLLDRRAHHLAELIVRQRPAREADDARLGG
jgi:hypothetical protein